MFTHGSAYPKVLKSIFTIAILELGHIIDIIFYHFKSYTISAGYYFQYLICPDFRKVPGIEPIHLFAVKLLWFVFIIYHNLFHF